MSAERQMNLAQTSQGRILLHLSALNKDWKLRWHVAGILREVSLRKHTFKPALHPAS
jgi:hypothetical protein